jgi:ornithine cyclodeaminase/alanine dehydrogenase-like protein (mu-crystallin family)
VAEVLLLSRSDLETILDFGSVIETLSDAFRAEKRGEWDTPKRIAAHTKSGGLLAMPCGGGAPESLGAKLVTTFSGNTKVGLPGVAGLYVLFDPATGVPLSVMDGAYLTLVRTASVSALATRLLSGPSATSLGVFGAGAQAEFHIRLIAAVRPIDHVAIWARRIEEAERLIARLRVLDELRQVSSWVAATRPEDAADSDVVVTATAAIEPILQGAWLRRGSHVNAIGAHTPVTRELDADVVAGAKHLAVETSDTLLEAGDFRMAERDEPGLLNRVTTIGDLLVRPHAHDFRAETPETGRSVFKSCGVAFEDLAVAALALKRARESRLGQLYSFS